ncbi:MAG: HD domain-containing protein [Magnetococcales bacterium]|nr:HD domain-containing protein [Magnetococcales bacterium]
MVFSFKPHQLTQPGTGQTGAGSPKRSVRLPISVKVVAVCLLVSLGNALLMVYHAHRELEAAIVAQVKNQALVYLQGIVWEMRQLPEPLAAQPLQQLLHKRHQHSQQESLDFDIVKLYLYDRTGRVVAYTGSEAENDKEMRGHYGEVVRQGKPYLSEKVEFSWDKERGREVAVLDAIVPVLLDSGIVGGLEAELNVDETMLLIQKQEDHYRMAIAKDLLLHALLLSVLVSWLIHRLLVRHVQHYDEVTQAIAGGGLTSRVAGPLPEDEVGRLGHSVNQMAASIEALMQAQEEAYLQALRSLTQALEAKDAYTAMHSSRVSKFSVQLGRRLGLDEGVLELLRKGALMHDLGKIGVRDRVLNKPEPLDEAEMAEMQSHPRQTAAIMRPLQRFKEFAEIAAWHHERWDGEGYPDGLRGAEIPLLARIVSIADTWDAMTGDRVYRKGMPEAKALAILEAERESGQWDPDLVLQFVAMIRESGRSPEPNLRRGTDAPPPVLIQPRPSQVDHTLFSLLFLLMRRIMPGGRVPGTGSGRSTPTHCNDRVS